MLGNEDDTQPLWRPAKRVDTRPSRNDARWEFLSEHAEEQARELERILSGAIAGDLPPHVRAHIHGSCRRYQALAWDDGASRETDLLTAIGGLKSIVEAQSEQIAQLRRSYEESERRAIERDAQIVRLDALIQDLTPRLRQEFGNANRD